MNKNFSIKKISADETRPLRQIILRPHQTVEELIYPGDDALETVHFGVFNGNEIVGIVSLYKEQLKNNDEPDSWRFRGMATTETVRGMGLAKNLMNHCIEHVKSKNGKILWCSARTTAEKFYEKFGMKRVSDVFTPEGLGPHIIMSMEIK